MPSLGTIFDAHASAGTARRVRDPFPNWRDAGRRGEPDAVREDREVTLLRPEATVIPPDEPITPRRLEAILRAAGVPRKFVKALLAGGWKAAAGEGDDDDTEAAALIKTLKSAAEFLERDEIK
jgi:hypothetical protein